MYLKAHALPVQALLFETETKTWSEWVIGLASYSVYNLSFYFAFLFIT